jgi:hypothetical protein
MKMIMGYDGWENCYPVLARDKSFLMLLPGSDGEMMPLPLDTNSVERMASCHGNVRVQTP